MTSAKHHTMRGSSWGAGHLPSARWSAACAHALVWCRGAGVGVVDGLVVRLQGGAVTGSVGWEEAGWDAGSLAAVATGIEGKLCGSSCSSGRSSYDECALLHKA